MKYIIISSVVLTIIFAVLIQQDQNQRTAKLQEINNGIFKVQKNTVEILQELNEAQRRIYGD